jgi:hypothetical protein
VTVRTLFLTRWPEAQIRSQQDTARKADADPEIPVLPLLDMAIGEVDEDNEDRVDEEELPGELLDARELHGCGPLI